MDRVKPFFTGYRDNLKRASLGIFIAPFSLFAEVDWFAVLVFFGMLVLTLVNIVLYPIAVFWWPLFICFRKRQIERSWAGPGRDV